MKKFILFDHDGVLVDTEFWYFKAGERALADIGFTMDRDQYLRDMIQGNATWAQAVAAGIDEQTIGRQREIRNAYNQEYLRTEDIEIEGVLETLDVLADEYRMGIITTSKPDDFALIHKRRSILDYMDFYLARDDYERAKPHPEPYLKGLERFGATATEAVVVEDSSRGLASAIAAGIDCIVVANEFTASHDLSQATAKVATFRELPTAIKGLAS
ncbi:MAG: HAD-IA family hydrolase [Chloroflexi bacterium]|nr:HAD-IA family hydrolase [Chloroflexota bacterium]